MIKEYLPFAKEAIENAGSIYEIIIVDDCSTDDSIEMIRADFPYITLIANNENKGFSHACNA